MIHDDLTNAKTYAPLSPGVARGLEWLARFDPSTPDGRVDIEPGVMFALVQSYETRPPEAVRFEAHRIHLDIQFIALGHELILRTPTPGLTPLTAYDEPKDITFYADRPAFIPIRCEAGSFTILHPQDAHKPGVIDGTSAFVKKVVLKVRL